MKMVQMCFVRFGTSRVPLQCHKSVIEAKDRYKTSFDFVALLDISLQDGQRSRLDLDLKEYFLKPPKS